MFTRRQLLAALAGLPFVGRLIPAKQYVLESIPFAFEVKDFGGQKYTGELFGTYIIEPPERLINKALVEKISRAMDEDVGI